MHHPIKKPSSKDISFRIIARWLEVALGQDSGRKLFYAWLILFILCLVLSAFILNWAVDIRPPAPPEPDIAVSVTQPDRDHLGIMITYTGKNTSIRYLTYNSSSGSGFINKSSDPHEYVRDAGEEGIITIPDRDKRLEILAIMSNGKTIKVYP